jgi:hypothetical protein
MRISKQWELTGGLREMIRRVANCVETVKAAAGLHSKG